MTPLSTFAPDADPTTAGIITDCENLIPYLDGMEGAPAPVDVPDAPALADPCKGAAVLYKLDNSYRVLAGTEDAMYELSGGVWSDVRDTGGYTGSPDTQWSFAQFGDAALASNGSEAIQRSTSGAFAAIAGAPSAQIIFSTGQFVMALNVNDGIEKPDGWHCCAAFDETDWTESVTTQSASGRLVSTPGRLVAGLRLGDYAIAYKEKSIYVGQYVGAPEVWNWRLVGGGEAGAVGKRSVCDIGGMHFVVGQDNFFLFDGVSATPIGDGFARRYFIDTASPVYLYKTQCVYDREHNRVWIFYPGTNSVECDRALVYHVISKKWGKADRDAQAVVMFVSGGLTYDTLYTVAPTYDSFPDISYDSPFWVAGSRSLAVFNSNNQAQTYDGLSTSSSLTTWHTGDDDAVTLMQQIRLRYALAPLSAIAYTYSAMDSGSSFTIGPSGAMNDGKFDTLKAARWHYARIEFTGPVKVTQAAAKYKLAGSR